ncbi:MAG: hypothetical protein KF691_14620 [Phycisphaeraceae bacterium]|nr:hypothetical protein [Phycisphaeraceae bacterium]
MTTASATVDPILPHGLLLLFGPVLAIGSAATVVFGSSSPLSCLALPALPLGIVVCLIGLFFKPRWPAILGLVLGLVGGSYFVMENSRLNSGHLRISEYPQMLQLASGGTTHFPRAIPANATDVRITALGPYGWLPAPDFCIDLRYYLPPADAEKVRAQAETNAIAADPKTHGTDPGAHANQFILKHGGHPAGFKSYLLVIPNGGMNAGGVSVNTTTGEVIYWVVY